MNDEQLEELKNAPYGDLVKKASQRYSIGVDNGPMAELNRRLIESIQSLDKTTSRYSRWLLGFTIVIGILTLIMAIPVISEIINKGFN